MKKFKAILALLLVAALFVTLFAACAKDTGTNTDTPADTSTDKPTDTNTDKPADTETDDPAETDDPVEEDSLIFSEGEIIELNMVYMDLRISGEDHGERIQAAINEYLEPTYGLHLNIQYMPIGDFLTKVQIALSGGERIDIMTTLFTNSVSNLYPQGLLTDITDLVDEYAPEALEIMQDYVGACTYNGRLYAFPVMKNWVSIDYAIMIKEVLDELNLTEKAINMTTWSEFEEILGAVAEAYNGTGMYAMAKSAARVLYSSNGGLQHGDNFADIERWDTLGDSASVVYVKDNVVGLYQAQPAYEEEMIRARKWADNGWVWPDSALTDTHGDELLAQGITFANIQASEIGVEVTKGQTVGKELICTKISAGTVSTNSVSTWTTGIPITSEEPEAAVYLLNLLYTDEKLMNLITWGVEGQDYEIVDGQAKHFENSYTESDFLLGNMFLLTPLYGNGADHYDKVRADIDNAPLSDYLGFALDKTDLDLAVSQLTAVNDQYSASLACGMYTKEMYDEYLAKLEAAGVYDYLAEVQTQLDAWLATQ